MNRYDDRARLVFHFAREEGSKLGHAMIGPEHLLLGLMREGGATWRRGRGMSLSSRRRAGWTLDRVQPFDFYPQTHHIELLSLLTRS